MSSSRDPADYPSEPSPEEAFDVPPDTYPVRLVLQRGRGATGNLQGRYELDQRLAYDDGWPEEMGEDTGAADADAAAPPRLRTEVFQEYAKSILSRNQSPDVPFNVSLNPYRGCEHGCIYCFARPTHSYLGLSPGLDFESRIYAKVNAAQLLQRELAKPSYRVEPIALGVVTDAYQPVERELRITRQVLEVLEAHRHPVVAITKSSLIERDIDLLGSLALRGQAFAAVTITTLDPALARILEPRAATPARRLRTIRTLVDAGIPVGVSVAPLIPFITEPDLERVLEACAQAGATTASYIVLRLPWEVAPLFKAWLAAHYPDRAERVMNRVREMRGGADYDASFAHRMKGEGLWADLLRQRFRQAARRLGLTGRERGILDISEFHRPVTGESKSAGGQLDLF
jgi:DNA repair photolyase